MVILIQLCKLKGLGYEFLNDNCSIMSTKPECVAKSSSYGPVLYLIKGKVQFIINVGIFSSKVDGRRNCIVANGHHNCYSFDNTSSTKQMTSHRFRGANIQLI